MNGSKPQSEQPPTAGLRVTVQDDTDAGLRAIVRKIETQQPTLKVSAKPEAVSFGRDPSTGRYTKNYRPPAPSLRDTGPQFNRNPAGSASPAASAPAQQDSFNTGSVMKGAALGTGEAIAFHGIGQAAAVAAPAVAGFGGALSAAGTALAGLAAAAAPLLIPLAAIAAVAGVAYVALFKWESVPGWLKPILLVVSPLVLGIRAVVTAVNLALLPFKALAAVVSLAALPFRLGSQAVGAFRAGLAALPGLARSTASTIGAIAASLASMPGRSMSALGGFLSAAGAGLQSMSGRVIGGLTQAAGTFRDYGVQIADIASKYEVSSSAAAVFALAHERTGMSIDQLVKRMPEGSAAFAAYAAETQRLGLSMNDSSKDAVAYAASQQRLNNAQRGFWSELGSAVAPALRESAELMVGAIRAATKWVSEHKPLIATAFQVASSVATVGTVLAGLGSALGTAGTVLSPLVIGLGAVAAGLAVVEYRTGAGKSLWDTYSASVVSIWQTCSRYLGQMWAFASKVFSGIADAVQAGNLELAVQIAWGGAKVAWITSLQEIDDLTSGVFGGILEPLASGNWAAAGEGAMGALQIAFQAGMIEIETGWESLKNTFDGVWTAAKMGWNVMLQSVFKGTRELQGYLSSVLSAASSYDPTGMIAKATEGLNRIGMQSFDAAGANKQEESALSARQFEREAAAGMAGLRREQEITKLKERQAGLAATSGHEAENLRRETGAQLDGLLHQARAEKEASGFEKPDIGKASSIPGFSAPSAPIGTFASERVGAILAVQPEDKAATAAKQQEQAAKLIQDAAAELKKMIAAGEAMFSKYQFIFGS